MKHPSEKTASACHWAPFVAQAIRLGIGLLLLLSAAASDVYHVDVITGDFWAYNQNHRPIVTIYNQAGYPFGLAEMAQDSVPGHWHWAVDMDTSWSSNGMFYLTMGDGPWLSTDGQDLSTNTFTAVITKNGLPYISQSGSTRWVNYGELDPISHPGWDYYFLTMDPIYFGSGIPGHVDGPPDDDPGDDPPPPPCTTCGCPQASNGTTRQLSVIDNVARTYTHDAVDFAIVSASNLCSSCGQKPTGQECDPLEIKRLHRYADIDRCGSFGPGVFSGYDRGLTLSVGSSTSGTIARVEWWSPDVSTSVLCAPAATAGVLVPSSPQFVRSVTVVDAAGVATTTLASAARATALFWDGRTETFELYSLGSAYERHGRMTARTKPNGRQTVLTYAYPTSATLVALGYDRNRLRQVASITDPAGRSAGLTYGQQDGQWVVTQIACPDGQTLTYQYGSGVLVGVQGVSFANGDQSSFAVTYDTVYNMQTVAIADASAVGRHRSKSVKLSPAANNLGPCAPGRLRRLVDGTGSLCYFAWTERLATPETSGVDARTYVFEGNGSETGTTAPRGTLLRLDTAQGVIRASYRAITWDLAQNVSTYTWELAEADTPNGLLLAERTTPNGTPEGLKTVYERDADGAVIGEKVYQGTTLLSQTSQVLNALKKPLHSVDADGHVTDRTYDTAGNLLTETVAVGEACQAQRSWTYDANGLMTSATDERGSVTDYAYDAGGRMTRRTEPADRAGDPRAVWQWTYDSAGRLASTIDPLNRTTTFVYDARGRAVETHYADGSVATTVYGSGVDVNLVVAEINRVGNRTNYQFDGAGRVTATVIGAETPANSATEAVSYLPGSSLEAARSGRGASTSFVYDTQGRRIATCAQVAAGRVQVSSTAYDAAGREDTLTDPFGRRSFLVYDQENRIVRTVRELVPGGVANPTQRATVARVLTANPPYVIDETEYDLDGREVASIDACGIRRETVYDARGRTVTIREAVGTADLAVTQMAYDVASSVVSTTSPAGRVVTSTYTGRGLLATRTEGAGSAVAATTSYAYTLTGKPWTVTDPRGGVTTSIYGTCCDYLDTVTDPLGFQTHFGRDALGREVTVTDANGVVTSQTYDSQGRVSVRSNGLGVSTTTAYDVAVGDGTGLETLVASALADLSLGGMGTITQSIGFTGDITYQISDGLGRVVRSIDPAGKWATVSYDTLVTQDGVTLVETAVTDPLGHVSRSRVDGAGQQRAMVDALGKISRVSFDAVGNQVGRSDASGLGWTATYDDRRRLKSRTTTRSDTVETVQWGYDADGNRTSETDALGQSESSEYDARNHRVLLTDRVGGLTRFAYDATGNLIQISDAENEARGGLAFVNGSTQYAHDARNLLVAEAFPTGQQGRTLRTYGYDPGRRLSGRLVGILNGAFAATAAFVGSPEATSYAYDAANRLTTRGYDDARNDTFVYDAAGRLTGATSMRYASTVTRGYDTRGRLSSEALTIPDGALVAGSLVSATYAVGYQYDDAGQMTGMTYPSGMSVVRSYSDRGELTGITAAGQAVVTRVYDDSGRLGTSTLGNGVVETRTYVPGSPLVASISAQKSGATVAGFGYTYDAAGRKLGESDAIDTLRAQQFGYDTAGRLTSWVQGLTAAPTASQSWNLSPVGDWTSTNRSGVVENRTHTAVHEATVVGGMPLSYDAKGNLTLTEQATVLAWDAENRLKSAWVTPDVSTTGFGAVATYRYDALGRRIAKTVQGRTTLFLPAGAQTVVEIERDALPPSQAQIDGAEADGTLANLALAPASGGILPGTSATRINFQSATAAIPAGFLADKGRPLGTRTNGLTYGWSSDATAWGVERHGAVPLPEFDTFIQAQPNASTTNAWTIALPNGSYPVIVVAGDARSTEQTNNLSIGGQVVTDGTPSAPASYEQGNFDGYAVQVTVSNGSLTIVPSAGAVNAKLCFVEIGAAGSTISQATRDRLAALIAKANTQTGASLEPPVVQKEYVYGSYIDEVVAYQTTIGVAVNRYFVNSNHLYSPAALSDSSGVVIERMKYDAYGRQTIFPLGGTPPRCRSSVDFDRGFTGQMADSETGLLYFRSRLYSVVIAGFISRDSLGFIDGYSLYKAHFIPNGLDPSGNEDCSALSAQTFSVSKSTSGLGYFFEVAGNLSVEGKRCKKCCERTGSQVVDYELKGHGRLEANFVINPFGWRQRTEAYEMGAFIGGQAAIGLYAEGEGGLATDKCNGVNKPTSEICIEGGLHGAINLGAEAYIQTYGWLELNFRMGATVSGIVQAGIKKCWTCTVTGSGYRCIPKPATIPFKMGVNLNLNGGMFGGTWAIYNYETELRW